MGWVRVAHFIVAQFYTKFKSSAFAHLGLTICLWYVEIQVHSEGGDVGEERLQAVGWWRYWITIDSPPILIALSAHFALITRGTKEAWGHPDEW